MGKIIYPLMGSAQRQLFDMRRIWGANVQERQFVEVLKKYLDVEILEIPELKHFGYLRSFYQDLLEREDVSVLIAPPDALNLRFYVKDSPAFVSTFHSVGHIEVIRHIILATATFAPEFDRFIAGSRDAVRAIQKIGSHFQCNVMPTYGVYSPLFDHITMEPDEVREKYGIPLHDKILLYIGRVSREKNVHELIRMFKVIHTRVPDTSLLIGGPIDPLTLPSLREQWVAQLRGLVAKLNIADAVFFTFEREDFIRPRDLSSIYNVCDVFLYPTVYSQETRAIAPLEAMMARKPVVATAWDGLQDSVIHGENGYLVDVYRTANYPAFDFYKFIQYTVHLLRHPDLRAMMGENARRTAEQFTTDRTAELFARIVYECQERYEARRTDPPWLANRLSEKVTDVFQGICPSPYIDLLDPTDSLEEHLQFGFMPQNLTSHHLLQTETALWQLISHFANRDASEIRARDYSSFVSTMELVIQPFSEITGINSPAIPSRIFWFLPLTIAEWNRFFTCFREVDSIPIFTPETDADYEIATRLISYGFLLPLEDPLDLTKSH